jgi:DNA sulfur modification protein DndD
MNLRIERIQYQNIREFQDLELDFTAESEDPHHISLVQMPNGTGKTTTMNLIRATLLGLELSEDEVSSFSPNEFSASIGKFEIDLRTPNEIFTLQLQLDYDIGESEYRHIKPQEARGGNRSGHYMPPQLRNIIEESFVDLFVFNGELTEDFLSRGKNEAENALKIVNFLNRIEIERERIEQVVSERQEGQNVTTEQGYGNIKARVESSAEMLERLKNQKREEENRISDREERISEIEDERRKILEENEKKLEKYKQVRKEIEKLRSNLEGEVDSLLSQVRSPRRLSDTVDNDIQVLLHNMNIMKLPKSTSQEFFAELAESDKCICGRSISDTERDVISERSERFLSEKDIGVLNAMKDNLRASPEDHDFDQQFSRIAQDRDMLHQKQQELAAIDIEDEKLNERLEELASKKTQRQNELEESEEMLEMLTTNDTAYHDRFGIDWQRNIPLCKARLDKFENRLREASGTVEFGKKADLLESIFAEFTKRCLDTLKRAQIKKTNQKLEQILGLSKVQVEDIDDSIRIEGRDKASEGQSLSIAYAYLASLFEDSRVGVPFVIDSPVGSIDLTKREQIAEVVPQLFDQLIIFVISSEREGFVSELESKDIQYRTVHKTGTAGEIRKNNSRSYFMEFQSEEEEDVRV